MVIVLEVVLKCKEICEFYVEVYFFVEVLYGLVLFVVVDFFVFVFVVCDKVEMFIVDIVSKFFVKKVVVYFILLKGEGV